MVIYPYTYFNYPYFYWFYVLYDYSLYVYLLYFRAFFNFPRFFDMYDIINDFEG